MKTKKYNNEHVAVDKMDLQIVKKLKQYWGFPNTNRTIHCLIAHYLNSGDIEEIKKEKILGAKLYEMFNR